MLIHDDGHIDSYSLRNSFDKCLPDEARSIFLIIENIFVPGSSGELSCLRVFDATWDYSAQTQEVIQLFQSNKSLISL